MDTKGSLENGYCRNCELVLLKRAIYLVRAFASSFNDVCVLLVKGTA